MGIFSRNPKSGLVGIVLALLAPSSDWSADLFTVRGVSVDVTAATAVAARAPAERVDERDRRDPEHPAAARRRERRPRRLEA